MKIGKKVTTGMLLFSMILGLAACGKSTAKVDNTVSVDTIHEAIKEAYG